MIQRTVMFDVVQETVNRVSRNALLGYTGWTKQKIEAYGMPDVRAKLLPAAGDSFRLVMAANRLNKDGTRHRPTVFWETEIDCRKLSVIRDPSKMIDYVCDLLRTGCKDLGNQLADVSYAMHGQDWRPAEMIPEDHYTA